MPRSDNRSCERGLALGFGFHQDACLVSKHNGRNSTTLEKYVNELMGYLFAQMITRLSTHLGNGIFCLLTYHVLLRIYVHTHFELR
jgi:hypothetical protein